MEIYIEYALAENFLLDAMLLWLAMKAAKQEISLWRIVLAAAIGAAFAVAFPLLKTGKTIAYILKFSVGALLCLVAVKGKGIGRYALTALLFFGFSFALGGLFGFFHRLRRDGKRVSHGKRARGVGALGRCGVRHCRRYADQAPLSAQGDAPFRLSL